jgi:hypothetical protein
MAETVMLPKISKKSLFGLDKTFIKTFIKGNAEVIQTRGASHHKKFVQREQPVSTPKKKK